MRAMWLILAVLTACSGDTPSETPEAAPPEAAPAEDAKVTLAAYSFTLRQGTDPDLDNQVTTTLVIAGPSGQSWDVGPFYGECAPQDSKAAYALRCTIAGVTLPDSMSRAPKGFPSGVLPKAMPAPALPAYPPAMVIGKEERKAVPSWLTLLAY